MNLIQAEGIREFFDRLPEAVKVLNRQGMIQVVNPAGRRLLEAGSDEEIRGRALADWVPEPYRAAFQAWQQRAWSGSPEPHEFPLTGLRGAER